MENEFKVFYYLTENGNNPVKDFIDSINNIKLRSKVLSMITVLQLKGNMIGTKYSSYLRDGIFELRCGQSNNIVRILYFFYVDRKIIFTNGFIKKTEKTPDSEIDLAINRKNDFIRRMK